MIYPVVSYYPEKKNGILYAHLKPEKESDLHFYKSNGFNRSQYIDSNGDIYKTIAVRNLGWSNIFWGYSLIKKGRSIKIEIDVEKFDHISLSDFKQFVLDRLKNNPLFSSMDEDGIRSGVINSTTYSNIINLLH